MYTSSLRRCESSIKSHSTLSHKQQPTRAGRCRRMAVQQQIAADRAISVAIAVARGAAVCFPVAIRRTVRIRIRIAGQLCVFGPIAGRRRNGGQNGRALRSRNVLCLSGLGSEQYGV